MTAPDPGEQAPAETTDDPFADTPCGGWCLGDCPGCCACGRPKCSGCPTGDTIDGK